jgi:hypothetical protein
MLTAQDGASWILEDADVADARPPLRVFVLIHPEDQGGEAARFVETLERDVRARAGLPSNAPVVLRRLQAANWRGPVEARTRRREMTGTISTWRAAVRQAIGGATALVIVATQEILADGWAMDTVNVIRETRRWPRTQRP